ncbi:sister chromatid cohesion protein PDS5 homolog A [Humulus lupulus]|uniref:sister chromatid cohesion protein PDS5 homolog A n=1 Tax=Humulus lupulus TaxID=3486 RepID=UPI002B40A088|nr:sister chromatid cohesion protein PDS5 homolog A [Humulus lupulus]
MAQKLEQQLKELGSKLETLPPTKDALVKLLKQAATCLSELDQSPSASVLESMQPFINEVVKPELLKHQDRDVKLLVATSICEITRITAPEAPYSDDVLKDIFQLIVGTFGGLRDTNGPSFGRRVVILETLAKYRSCVVMLDLECDDLVNEMFSTFLAVASDDHPDSVISSMQTIMVVLLEESEDVRDDLLFIILSVLGRGKTDVSMAARKLAMSVIEKCAGKLEAGIKQFLISSMSGDSKSVKYQIDHHEVIYDVYRCAPQILTGVAPYLTGELLTDQLDTRLKAVGLVGDLFALPSSVTSEAFQPIFAEFLKRLTDRNVTVRMSVVEHVKSCLLSNTSRTETPEIISALCDRLLDFDENVRKQVVAVICDVACHALSSIPLETVKLVAERLRDKSLIVKKYTLERLAEIYRVCCVTSVESADGSIKSDEFDWIPGKILRCFYDKDFRSDTIESVICESLFPTEFSIKDKVRHWARVFAGFDKVEVKALEKTMEQKQRLQQEMQRYLSLRQMYQDGDGPEIQKKVLFCFRVMSRSFADPAKAEENFQILDQLKDANIWKILTSLVDPNTSFHQACTYREDLLRILGEKHRLYDFLSTLSVKSSYLLFNKEHVKELLLEVAAQKLAGNSLYTSSCMNILVILARFSPMLLSGAEEELICFLKDGDEIIKEGVLHVLAKAGGIIREQLAVSTSSIDLLLERLCLEGSRRQAKYAVHALAAITKDDGLKSLSVLYKRLVDMLEEKTHLPAVLQSLGCIAQTAMPVFETRESEIEEFIINKILKCNNKTEGGTETSWDERSELCLLKIFGIKTLVKSYLPVKDANVRPGIDGLLEILRNILTFGEMSKDIESSSVDKAHFRLASAKAILRLSKFWDHKIPLDVFHLTLRISEINFPEAKSLFLSKVHQYIKDRILDGKYACAFLFNIFGSKPSEFQEEKQNLADIIQMYHQTKARQLSIQSDANSLAAYPEYILPYLVHVLAHHSCPNIDECKDVKAYEVIYRQLYLILSMLVHRDEDVKSEASNNMLKETIFAIISIFQSINQSEDIVDAEKSKNSHAICDLGLSITKRLAPKDYDAQGLTASAPLPPMMYKPYEKKEGDDSVASEGKTWLADESSLKHFESLKLETSETLVSETAEDEILKEGEGDGNEVPLGKIIKHLRSKGAKGKKSKRDNSTLAVSGIAENDVDVLKMVREINLDNLGKSNKFESSNGHEHSPSKKSTPDLKHKQNEKRKASDETPVPVPKRRRSSSGQSAFRSQSSTSKVSSTDTGDDLLKRKLARNNKSDMLTPRFQKNVSSSKRKGKGLDWSRNDETNEVGEASDREMATGRIDTNSDAQFSSGSVKKRKRKSVAVLAKCKFKEGGKDIEDLIGCRIKVWWPMDKQFYEGTVKSFDTMKKKHVILYDDGDVEVLRLEKERWELVDSGRKPTKKLNSSKASPSKDISHGKTKNVDDLRQKKKTIKPAKGKRTPKKVLKHGGKGVSKGNHYETEDKESSDVSNLEPSRTSEVEDEMNSGGSEGEHDEKMDENMSDERESDNEVKPVSKRKQLIGKKRSPIVEESDEEKPGERVAEDMDMSQNSDEEKQHSEDDHEDESSDALGEQQAKEEEKTDSEDDQGNQAKDEEKTDSEDNQEHQVKDDEKTDSEGDQVEQAIEEDKTDSEDNQDEQAKEEDKTDSEDNQEEQAKEEDKTDSEDNQEEQVRDEEKTDSEDNQEEQAKEEERTDSEEERTNSEDNQQENEEEKSGSEDNEETNDVGTSPLKSKIPDKEPPNSLAGDDELSDDEPLSNWKNRVAKKGSNRVR